MHDGKLKQNQSTNDQMPGFSFLLLLRNVSFLFFPASHIHSKNLGYIMTMWLSEAFLEVMADGMTVN